MGTLHEDQYMFMIISQWTLLRLKKVSGEFVEKTNRHISYSVTLYFRKTCCLWYNMEKFCRTKQDTDYIKQRMLCSCWITKATNAHSEYVILITFPQQQWLHECTTMLSYRYTACIIWSKSIISSPFAYISENNTFRPLGYVGCIATLTALMSIHSTSYAFIHPAIQSSTQLARYPLHLKTSKSARSPVTQTFVHSCNHWRIHDATKPPTFPNTPY
jgi:hypothetical protein